MGLYIAIGVDNIKEKIFIIGFGDRFKNLNERRIKRLKEEPELQDVVHSITFDMKEDKFPHKLYDFLMKSGLTESNAREAVKQLGEEIKREFLQEE